MKTRLGVKNGAWVDELPRVLWAYRTTHKTSIGETSFALAFRHKAVEIQVCNPRGRLNWYFKNYPIKKTQQSNIMP